MPAAIGYQHASAAADARIAAGVGGGVDRGGQGPTTRGGEDQDGDEDDGSSGALVPAR